MKSKIIKILVVILSIGIFGQITFSQNLIGRIVKLDNRIDDQSKIPLIFIHGIHGFSDDLPLNETKRSDYWDAFKDKFNTDDKLNNKYVLYAFQYYSDKVSVRKISDDLGKEIDRVFQNRKPILVTHSMGGLVAKNYMVYYQHSTLRGPIFGGDRVQGLITLAAPHHGTPGANKPAVFEKYYSQINLETYFDLNKFNNYKIRVFNAIYWNPDEVNYLSNIYSKCYKDYKPMLESSAACLASFSSPKELKPVSLNSEIYNRKDLRWDNYDHKIDEDVNKELSETNQIFNKYSEKVILYAGILKPIEPKLSDAFVPDDHVKLGFAAGILYFDLTQAFGYTDGLVPYKSAMFCNANEPTPHDFQCESPFRIRRFEFALGGKVEEVAKEKFPNSNTLSITRKEIRGFDHKDMKEHILVWEKLREDLLNSFDLPKPIQPEETLPPIIVPTSPTLFLFDVSGSMAENGKIDQARVAGLDALREMRENSSSSPSPVSILTFSGGCSDNVTQNLLGFTTNLTQAENAMSSRIPKPDGGTPLPQALQTSINTLTDYLNTNRVIKEGRIVVLSDGQSTCGEIRPAGIYSRRTDLSVGLDGRIKFLTVGFDVPAGSPAERDLQYLADISGGKYFNAQDRRQLIRAFQKLVRVFVPKMSKYGANPDFANGIKAFQRFDYLSAARYFRAYTQANDTDPFGWYNLALASEALDRYQAAADSYRKYLLLFPHAPDRANIEAKLVQLRQDRIDLFNYYAAVIQSDLDYLKRYYQSIFNRSNRDLAVEFNGFVSEKDDFYKNLSDILEINERWLLNDSKDLSDSISTLAERANLPTFERDAVSLLTISIAQLEDLTEKIENYRIKNLR